MNKSLVKEFKKRLGKQNVFTQEADLLTYSYDAAALEPEMPSVVLRPSNSEALSHSIRLCNENRLPLTVRGSGTNLSGGTIPPKGGAVLLTNALNHILEINEEDMYAVVQPGVITEKIALAVESKGLFYPPDPASRCVSTIGGNVAENAGGLLGLKYGVTKDYVMGIRFFNVQGEAIKTGSKTAKCVTGYNLNGLMIGSEGTLGVFDEITLKLIPLPVSRKSMIAVFPKINQASEVVSEIISHRMLPATLEIMDNFTIRAVEDYSNAGLPVDAGALLLIEIDGHKAQVEEDSKKVEDICRNQGATSIQAARDDAERDKIWEARRCALSALAKVKPTLVLEDATVPRSKIPDMIRAIQNISREYGVLIGTFGHAGDGNLHPTILTNQKDSSDWENAKKAIDAIFEHALSLGGTLSGEHGIGLAKSRFLKKETNEATISYSSQIKSALDPNNILNPDKILGA